MLERVLQHIDNQRDAVIDLHRSLAAIPALGPDNGGPGERDKADFVLAQLAASGITGVRTFDAPDPRVPCGHRPNIAAVVPGADSTRTCWVISHLDVVPPGDPGLWESDPYTLKVDGDVLVARGVEDNHQGLVASLLVGQALAGLGVLPPMNYGMLFVSDEETGSKYGLEYLLRRHPELFTPRDLFLIPDFGLPSGEMVEVAEKSILWLKITLLGKQCHASTPELGVNTLVASADYILRLAGLKDRFPARDTLFSPPFSTFAPTKKEANVESVNTIPGRDVFYVDCRVLPQYPLDEVIKAVHDIGREISHAYGVDVRQEIVQKEQAAPATPVDAEIVGRIVAANRLVYGNDPRPMGVGGGTVAAYLRKAGYHSVVWACWVPNAHQPNERSSIRVNIGDAKVIAAALFRAS